MELPKVIYIDDEPGLLEITKLFLEYAGDIQVDTEQCSLDVLDILSRRSYDVIVSDYQMPGMNGIELLKVLRARGDLTPFILFTGRGREEVAIEALNSGADFYIQKGGNPQVQFGELKNAIIQLVQRKKAEHQVAQSEQKYRDLVEGASSIILKLDANGNITFINQFGKEYFGCTTDVAGMPMFGALIRPDEFPERELGELMKRFLSGDGKASTFTFPIRQEDGTNAWASWNTKAIRDKEGNIREFLVIGNDVTAARNAETELQKSMSQMKAMLESSDEGVLLLDSNNHVVQYNSRLLDIWKLPSSAIEARSDVKALVPALEMLKDPGGYAKYVNQLEGRPETESRIHLELQDGRVIEEHSLPVIIGNNVVGRLLTYRVPPQKMGEGVTVDSEAAFWELYNDNLAVILFVDPQNGNIVDANEAACRFYGYDHESLKRMNIVREIVVSSNAIERCRLAEKGVHRFSSQHRMASNEVKDVEVFTGPVASNGRKLLFTMVQDVTEMNRAKRLFDRFGVGNDDMLELIGEGVMIIDPTSRIIYANHRIEDILMRPMGEIINTPVLSHIAAASKEQAIANLEQRSQGFTNRTDYKMIRGNGTEFWAMVSARPLFKDGEYAGTTYFVTDVNERRRQEDRLKASEANLLQIIKNALGGIWVVDSEWRTTYVNDALARTLGYTSEELLQRSPIDLMDERTRRALWSPEGAQDRVGEHEVRLLRSNGMPVPAWISAFSVQFEGETLGGSVVFVSDSDESGEDAPLSNHSALGKAIASMSSRFTSARPEDLNAVLSEGLRVIGTALGASRASIYMYSDGRQGFDCVSSWCADEHTCRPMPFMAASREQSKRWLEKIERCDGPLTPYVIGNPSGMEEMVFPESDVKDPIAIFPMMIEGYFPGFLAFENVLMRGDDSVAIHDPMRIATDLFVSALRRKEAFEALNDAGSWYCNIIDSFGDAVFVMDVDDNMVLVNRACIELLQDLGLDTDIVGHSVFQALPFLDERSHEEIDQAIREGRPVVTEEVIDLNGGKKIILVSKTPLWDGGRIDRVLVVLHDITERRMLEESLQGANRKLNLLYNITRHDINNQLLVLRGNLDIIRRRSHEPENLARLDIIDRCAGSIWRQIEFTKTYQEMGTKMPQWQQVGMLICSIATDWERIERLEASDRLRNLVIYGDPMLGKVFSNLVEDSIKYASDHTIVSMDCQEGDDHLLITYEDVGPGIPVGEKERIFQNGYGKGTGFGLFLCREVLAITGMTIQEAGEPGKGVRFEITVPHGQYRFDAPPSCGQQQSGDAPVLGTIVDSQGMIASRDQGAGGPAA
ncbi:MAG: PAS domain S-box protein [Methanomassiliicoccus sp.]|nr:PAS domain S-box protein [Methanomassiliicoccus sp.]